jgi:hypothetical protein
MSNDDNIVILEDVRQLIEERAQARGLPNRGAVSRFDFQAWAEEYLKQWETIAGVETDRYAELAAEIARPSLPANVLHPYYDGHVFHAILRDGGGLVVGRTHAAVLRTAERIGSGDFEPWKVRVIDRNVLQ